MNQGPGNNGNVNGNNNQGPGNNGNFNGNGNQGSGNGDNFGFPSAGSSSGKSFMKPTIS